MARPLGRCVRAAGLLSLGVLVTPVSAAPVEYYISAGAYTDIYGGASGSGPVGRINGAFTYDAATGAISDVHIAVVDQVYRSGFELPADPALYRFVKADGLDGDGAQALSLRGTLPEAGRLIFAPAIFPGTSVGTPRLRTVTCYTISGQPCLAHGTGSPSYRGFGALFAGALPVATRPSSGMELTLTDSAGEDVSDPFGRLRILPDGADRAGTVGETTGDVLVRRADGTTFTPRPGDEIGLGDRIETMDDGSEFDVPADTSLDIDAFVYDPDSDDTPYELKRPLMEFMRTLLRVPQEPEPDIDDDTPRHGLVGLRGDAKDELRRHLLENPEDVLGYVGIYMETASPVGVSTLVAASDDIAVLSFDYSFLSGAGFLSVELGGTEIFFDIAGVAGEMRSTSLSLDIGDPGRLSELLFRVDGEAGLGFSLWNVMFDGTPLDDLDAFARLGAGPVTAALIASSEEYDRMLAGAGVVPTPVPAAGLLLAGALGAMAHVGRRRRTRA